MLLMVCVSLAQGFAHGLNTDLPLEGWVPALGLLRGVTSIKAFAALNARKHHAFDVARLQSHGTDTVTGGASGLVTGFTVTRTLTRKCNHHAARIRHPRETLKETYRTTKATK
jgi:hypothetical protein